MSEREDTLNTGDFFGHVRGAAECPACWFGTSEECEEDHPAGCRVHTEFGDENSDGDYWLQRRHEADYAALAAQVPAQEERLREAARAMWYAHTEDERFAGPPSADPYMDFERELLRALVDESKEEA